MTGLGSSSVGPKDLENQYFNVDGSKHKRRVFGFMEICWDGAWSSCPPFDSFRIRFGFQLALGRKPSKEELQTLEDGLAADLKFFSLLQKQKRLLICLNPMKMA